MALVVVQLLQFGQWSAGFTLLNALILFAAVSGGVVSYLVVGRAVRISELKEVQALVLRKLRRRR
jgi:hypothetical protein